MKNAGNVFLLGASGMGMAPLAIYLQGSGLSVEAYDDHFCEPLRKMMQDEGIQVLHEPNPIETPDYVIRSSAIGEEHELVRPWISKEIPVIRRGDFLSNLLKDKKVIAVVGSHGKTTTTGMLVWSLKKLGFDFSYLVGGRFTQDQFKPGEWSSSPWVVVEVDESDGSIEGFNPEITVALNGDWDHVDQYSDPDAFMQTLGDLFERTRERIIIPNEDKFISLLDSLKSKTESTRIKPLSNPALFMQFSERAVQATIQSLGLDSDSLDFRQFPGMERRHSLLWENENSLVLEDYAHHPTEIQALLSWRQELISDARLRVVFQPHRYTRTKALAQDFADELSTADDLYLVPTYSAFEKFSNEGAVESIIGHLPPRHRDQTKVYGNFPDLRSELFSTQNQGDTKEQILFVGAGNIDKWAHAFASTCKHPDDKHLGFADYLSSRISSDCLLLPEEGLASKTTMQVGGKARWYAEPANVEDLRNLVDATNLFEIQRVMLGRGSNLIIPDDGFAGLVIRLKGSFWSEISFRSDEGMVVGAGARLKEICRLACKHQLQGFEFLEGIPGTLGGALRMNAGAMGWETFDLVEWVTFLMPDGQIRKISRSDMEVAYRFCKEASEGIALRAKLNADGKADHQVIREAIDKLSQKRRKSQPREASSGCVFRNPEELPAGKLIEEAGLKGEREGHAVVSDIHANFIVNEGGASAEDVIALVKKMRNRVKESNGVVLEPEIGLMGKDWHEFLS